MHDAATIVQAHGIQEPCAVHSQAAEGRRKISHLGHSSAADQNAVHVLEVTDIESLCRREERDGARIGEESAGANATGRA